MLTTQPIEGLTPGVELETFLARTREQIERFKELRHYPPRMMAIKGLLASLGIITHFINRTALTLDIVNPMTSRRVRAIIQFREQLPYYLEVYSPLMPFSFLVESPSAEAFVQRIKKGGLI